ncbi:metal ABC transporter solute-binding protein, Zn/Mn family [Hoeflea poritis]|uniref:Zinc ABC transporter substrate-binding protein n=1 Tax=Hoeflea poritis TaxID=2993659 RepID=A0ABT4VSI4_9HYPH|nr:zinc ABC transporter substrate-binding protein [Hoeflea poritis]MDA4847660.1 zinc ABC transporter substrate-binding protein [Hoeflea poritis]
MILRRTLALTAILAASLAFALPVSAARAAEKLNIVATVSMVGDALTAISGDRAEVTTLMGEGVDPHLYRQTQSDIAAMVRADAVFWNGLYLEAQLEEFLEKLAARKPVYAIGEAVPVDQRLSNADYSDRYDPHVWMTPDLWRYAVEAARDALVELDPEGAQVYTENTKAYLADLDRLAAFARQSLASVPQEKRVLITAHDAFGYFGQGYDFEVVGIQGLSTESEAGLQRVDEIVNMIVDRDIGAIFVETSVSERNVRALIEGAAARGHKVVVGGQLFSDAMGSAGTYTGTYIGMIDSNVTVITNALGGNAPAAGLNGKLAGS